MEYLLLNTVCLGPKTWNTCFVFDHGYFGIAVSPSECRSDEGYSCGQLHQWEHAAVLERAVSVRVEGVIELS